MVLSKFSWKRLLICLLGEVRATVAPCFCWTVSLSSFKSISALLRSEMTQKCDSLATNKQKKFNQWILCKISTCSLLHISPGNEDIKVRVSPRLRFRMLPVCGGLSCFVMPGAWEFIVLGLSREFPAGARWRWADKNQYYTLQLFHFTWEFHILF